MRDHETTIADIPKNSREIYRIARCTFNGHTGCQVRIWFKEGEDGEYRPSKRGVWLDLESVPKVAEALLRAVEDHAVATSTPGPPTDLPFDGAAAAA